jgi:hypothetical protein
MSFSEFSAGGSVNEASRAMNDSEGSAEILTHQVPSAIPLARGKESGAILAVG